MLKEMIPNRKILHGGCGGGGGGSGGGGGGWVWEGRNFYIGDKNKSKYHLDRRDYTELGKKLEYKRAKEIEKVKAQRLSKKDVLNLIDKAGTPKGLDLRYRNFTESNLEGIDLQGAILSDANFTRANLRGANLSGAKLGFECESERITDFIENDVQQALGYTESKDNLSSYAFYHLGIENFTLHGANLEEADLRKADLRYASFMSAKLPKANLSGTDLRYTSFSHANLQKINLTNANASRSCMIEANLSGAILTGADIRFSSLRKANLEDIDLTQTKLAGCDFVDANLRNVNMADMNLGKDTSGLPYPPNRNDKDRDIKDYEYVSLRGADLRNAILERTCLIGVSLYGTNLEGASLKDAKVGWDTNMENMTDFDRAKVTLGQLKQTIQQYAGGNLDQIRLPDGTYKTYNKTYKPLGSWLKRLF